MQTRILIVERRVERNTLKSIFEAEGYDVFEATDGAEMHQILSEYDINTVIMDINLRAILLLARELREQANDCADVPDGPRDSKKSTKFSASKSARMITSPNRLTRELTIRARNLLSRTMNTVPSLSESVVALKALQV